MEWLRSGSLTCSLSDHAVLPTPVVCPGTRHNSLSPDTCLAACGFRHRTDSTEQMHHFCLISAQVRGLFSAPLIEILLLHQKLRNADDHRRRNEPKTRPIQAYEHIPMTHDPTLRYTPSEPNVRLPRRRWVLLLHFSQGDRRVRTRRQIKLEENVVRAQSGAGGD